jgi:hypothetical protein
VKIPQGQGSGPGRRAQVLRAVFKTPMEVGGLELASL